MKIQGRQIRWPADQFSPVTYVPGHADGNAGHPDCEQGVIININDAENHVKVLYCTGRTIQATDPADLVWG